jgi:hypothetical protein
MVLDMVVQGTQEAFRYSADPKGGSESVSPMPPKPPIPLRRMNMGFTGCDAPPMYLPQVAVDTVCRVTDPDLAESLGVISLVKVLDIWDTKHGKQAAWICFEDDIGAKAQDGVYVNDLQHADAVAIQMEVR